MGRDLVQDALFVCKFVLGEFYEWDSHVRPGPIKLLLCVSLGWEFQDISSIEKVEFYACRLANWQETQVINIVLSGDLVDTEVASTPFKNRFSICCVKYNVLVGLLDF